MPDDSPDERQASELARLQDIRRIGTERTDEIARTLTDAFVEDPFSKWLFGQEQEGLEWRYWHWCCANHPASGEIHVTGDLSGAALWYPMNLTKSKRLAAAEKQYERNYQQFCLELLKDSGLGSAYLRIIRQCDKAIPNVPSWYLGSLGVERQSQGKGIGARLLAPMLRRCDEQGLPAYLDSSNPRNISFYERLGFRKHRKPVSVKGSAPLTPMVRPPRQQTEANA